MDAMLSDCEKPEASQSANIRGPETDGHLKNLLVDLIGSSRALDVRVWLDGVYTDIEDDQVRGEWMNNRDVYFKVEGRVDKRNGT
jgi:hypothetical protein